jgi:hypothetical protein
MKKAAFLVGILLFLALVSPVEAKSGNGRGLGQLIRQGVQEALRSAPPSSGTPTPREKNKIRQTIWERLKAKFPKLLPAGINRAEVVSILGAALPAEVIVSHEGREITLKLSQKTNILRKYGGKAALSELKEGDIVSARGTWEDNETKAILNVRVLRDLSLEKRQATFWGKVIALGQGSFTLETSKKGALTVKVGTSTKIVDRREKSVSLTDLAVGHRVRVTGLWDVTGKQMDPVRLIKDWSLGPNLTPTTPTVIPTITPTPTPSPTATPTQS